MTRHKTGWWSSLFPTSPQRLLRQPAGMRLVTVLTEWWMTLEGFDDGTWAVVDNSRSAVGHRYSQESFYARLDAVDFPVLADSDEHAVDKIFDGFEIWTRSRKARTLVRRLARDVGPDAVPEGGPDYGDRIQRSMHQQVHHHVSAQVHQHIHAHVHHAVSHAAHNAGHGGAGHAGGGHH